MEEVEKRLKEIEIKEKSITNRTIWIAILTPVLSILISYLTSVKTAENEIEKEKLSFSQDRISGLLKTDDIDLVRKMKFLIDANLISNDIDTINLSRSMRKHLFNDNNSLEFYVKGVIQFEDAWESNWRTKDIDSLNLLTDKFLKAIDNFKISLYHNTKNHEARISLAASYKALGIILGKEFFYQKSLEQIEKVLDDMPGANWVNSLKLDVLERFSDKQKACPSIIKMDTINLSIKNKKILLNLKEKCTK